MSSTFNYPAAGYRRWKAPVTTSTDLPILGSVEGDVRIALDTLLIWIFDGSVWVVGAGNVAGPVTPTVANQIVEFADTTGTVLKALDFGTANQLLGMTSAATGHEYKTLSVGTTGTDFAIAHAANSVAFNLPDASATARGVVTTGTQTLSGNKTLSGQTILGDAGTEASGIDVNGATFQSTLKVSDIDGTHFAQTILHRHSTVLEPLILGARSNTNDNTHADVTAGQNVFTIYGSGWAGSNYKLFGSQSFSASALGTISNTSAPGKWTLGVTQNGAVTPSTAITVDSDLSSTFAGTIKGTTQGFLDIGRYGFLNQTETTLSFNDSTGVFTLAPSGTTWSYYRAGIKYTITGSKTVTVASPLVDGTQYFIYIDSTDGALISSTTVWALDSTKVLVAMLHWNSTQTPKYFIQEERHACLIDRRQHLHDHSLIGTRMRVTGAISGQTVNTDTDAAKAFGIESSTLLDEDIIEEIPSLTDPEGLSAAYKIVYRTGASAWAWADSIMPFPYAGGGYIQWDNAGTLTQATGGGGGSARFVNSYVVFTNIMNTGYGMVIIPGRAIYTTLAAAQAEDPTTFTFTNFITGEFVIAYQMTWSTVTSTSTGLCRLAATPRKISVSIVQTSGSAGAVDHNSLGGLQGGTALEYFHLTSAEYTGSGTGVFARVTSPTFATSIITPAINAAGALTIGTNGSTAAITVDTSQFVGIGNTTPGSFNAAAQNLVVGTGTGNNGITVYSGSTSQSALSFAFGTTTTQAYDCYLGYGHSTKILSFYNNLGTKALDILSDQTLKPVALLDLSTSTAGQIKFPATQNASSNANTLDDYEEGIFTPELYFGGASGVTTYAANGQVGVYTKVGGLLHWQVWISITTLSAATGAATIVGLPFSTANITSGYASMYCGYYAGLPAGTTSLIGYIAPNATGVNLHMFGAGVVGNVSNANFQNGGNFVISGSYRTA